MNSHLFRSMAFCAVAACAFAATSGCATSADVRATEASMDAFGVEIATVKDSIDGAVHSLETLVGAQASEIRANFDAYTKSLQALDRQARVVRKRAEEMKANGDAFFKDWEQPESVTPERRAHLTAAYAGIMGEMSAAKEGFAPFQKSLRDVENYLKLDLSPKGIESVGSFATQARDAAAKVKASIDAVLVQLNSVRGMLSTK